MELVTIFAFYFILWWLTLFIMLPIGVSTQEENDDVTLGTVSSAPSKPMILKKMLWTTIVSAVIMGAVLWAILGLGLSLDDLPFMPEFKSI